eukprot:TRINITY_DN11138_c0_g1_i1.p1 TRINITY_DN11138_c0_g1~~TRINITY_DN11138_c0_g1_i1.p1  ORF type:complete len:325 (+),score=47.94 TRINITY_DN11138_c0_g1_i1:40-975(+)
MDDAKKSREEFCVIKVPDPFDREALETLVNYLQGIDRENAISTFSQRIPTTKDILMLYNICELCDYYGISRPLKDILKILEECSVLVGFQLAQKLSKLPFYKSLASSILHGCCWKLAVAGQLESGQSIIHFVMENSTTDNNIDSVWNLCIELDPFISKKTYRIAQARDKESITLYPITLPAGDLKWKLDFSLSKHTFKFGCGSATLECNSRRDGDWMVQDMNKVTVDLECKIFKPEDWSCRTLFQEDGMSFHYHTATNTLHSLAIREYADFVKDSRCYFEVTIDVHQAENVTDSYEILEEEFSFPFREFSF